ncbi:MAG: hypothetical protein AAF561_06880 [Planctomycetota bacterium]
MTDDAMTTTSRAIPEAPDAEGNYAGNYRRNVWRRSWMQTLVPWMTSLVVHLGLVGVALALLVTVREVLDTGPVLEQATVASTKLATENVGATPNVGNTEDVTRQNASLNPVEQSQDFRSRGEGDSAADMLAAAGGATSSSITGITGMGEVSDFLGGGGGDGAPLFGDAGGSGGFMGMDTGTLGDGGDVFRIAFVCDSSGSMAGERQLLLFNELRAAIESLETRQSFNVVFFSNDDYITAFPGELKPATSRFKEQSAQWLLDSVEMSGETNPIPAIRAAFDFRQQPQLIFFLTDGRFDGLVSYGDVVSTIQRLTDSSSAPPMINTIQFINRDEQAEEVLKEIAEITGGEYRFVGRDFFGGQ